MYTFKDEYEVCDGRLCALHDVSVCLRNIFYRTHHTLCDQCSVFRSYQTSVAFDSFMCIEFDESTNYKFIADSVSAEISHKLI